MCPLMGPQLNHLYFYCCHRCCHEKDSTPHNPLCSFYRWNDAFSGPDPVVGCSGGLLICDTLVTTIGGYTPMPRSPISGLFPRLPGPGVETRPTVPNVLSSFSPSDITWPIPSCHRWSERGSLSYQFLLYPRGSLGIYADSNLLQLSIQQGVERVHILYLPN